MVRDQVTYKSRILEVIKARPGVSIALTCRTMNDRGISYCRLKACYANPQKKEKYGRRPSSCKYHLKRVREAVRDLEATEPPTIITRMEKQADPRQARMWDWMRACYLPEDYPHDRDTEPLKLGGFFNEV